MTVAAFRGNFRLAVSDSSLVPPETPDRETPNRARQAQPRLG
jgi:hypothetical protein